MTIITFRTYRDADREACTSIFDANCPAFFAPNERQEYEEFLERVSGDATGPHVANKGGEDCGEPQIRTFFRQIVSDMVKRPLSVKPNTQGLPRDTSVPRGGFTPASCR